MNIAIRPRCALLSFGMRKHKPAASSVQAIFGKVKRSSDRRPKVSIVHIAGQAKMKLTRPKPKEAISASLSVAPASEKTVEE